MREVIFRGRDIVTGEWVYGTYLLHTEIEVCPIIPREGELEKSPMVPLIIKSGFADWNMPKPLNAYKVVEETVGQYTGLLDRNGNKMFEGDLVMVVDGDDGWDTPGVIVFENGAFVVDGSNDELWSDSLIPGDFMLEIMGNIHDNPEMVRG